jgi:hypothetical protein
MEMRLQIAGGLGGAGADDERAPELVEGFEVGRRQHPGVGGHHDRRALQTVALHEAGDDRHDRGGLGGIAFVATDFERKPGTVDQQPDHNLWIDPPFLAVPDLA